MGVRIEKMNFHYHKSAKKRGIQGFVVCTLFSLMLVCAWFYLLFLQQKELGIIFGKIIGWFSIVLMPILFFWNYLLFKNPDKWDIKITDSEVIWNAPKNIGESSFRIKTNEILKSVCETSPFTDGTDSHYLILVDGNKINLKQTQSGININLFIQKLKDQGIKHEVN